MGRFGNDSKHFFENVYQQDVPWEIGTIQADLLDLLKKYPPYGKVLDIGCGSGDTAIDIARLGHEVIGIDFVEVAINKANDKAYRISESENVNVSFICGNGLKPSTYGKDFGAIIDSGFMHLFDDNELKDYIEELYSALVTSGRVYLIEFALEFEIPSAPRAITKAILSRLFSSDKWRMISLSDCQFINKVSPVPAIVACIEKKS